MGSVNTQLSPLCGPAVHCSATSKLCDSQLPKFFAKWQNTWQQTNRPGLITNCKYLSGSFFKLSWECRVCIFRAYTFCSTVKLNTIHFSFYFTVFYPRQPLHHFRPEQLSVVALKAKKAFGLAQDLLVLVFQCCRHRIRIPEGPGACQQ